MGNNTVLYCRSIGEFNPLKSHKEFPSPGTCKTTMLKKSRWVIILYCTVGPLGNLTRLNHMKSFRPRIHAPYMIKCVLTLFSPGDRVDAHKVFDAFRFFFTTFKHLTRMCRSPFVLFYSHIFFLKYFISYGKEFT